MIIATILDFNNDAMTARYRLNDDQDEKYVQEGTLSINLSDTPDTITERIQAIIDTANFINSLKPLVGQLIASKNPIPAPVTISEPPQEISQ